ncbi:MAG: capsular biosynthesis protein [Helicobacter sp.]|nr:capsular biosynthesis protein [Helicobacter sp.]
MKKACVVCEANPAKNQRPNRMLKWLKGHFELTAIGREATPMEGVEMLSYPDAKKRNAKEEAILEENVAKKDYIKLVKIPNRMVIEKYLKEREFDIIICHELVLLPIVLENKKQAKVIIDLQEYYPRLHSDERWIRLFADFNDWLCRTYLPQADYVYTTDEISVKEYTKNYGVKCDIIISAAEYYAFSPKVLDNSPTIKLLHHGMASRERGIEKMIETMDYVDNRFTLDLMLIATWGADYYEELKAMAQIRNNVRIIPPIPLEEIIPFSTQYDIGFYLLQPTNFNTRCMLPNKFFEFIQARLAIAISPISEMVKYLKAYDLGIVSPDFTPQSMAKALNALTKEQIFAYKENANKAAEILNATKEGEKLLGIIERVLSENN